MTHLNVRNSSELVEITLNKNWIQYNEPLPINLDDFSVAVSLLTEIAVRAVNKNEPVCLCIKATLEMDFRSLPGETIDKIKKFVVDKAGIFRKVCKTGFPFSLLDKSCTKIALKYTLKHLSSITTHFLMLEDRWLSEKELNECFSVPFQRLQHNEIVQVCFDLKQAYVKNDNLKAGYYLLWLIKQSADCSYEMPEKNLFNDSTVSKVLIEFIKTGTLRNSTIFIEILNCDYKYQRLLDQPSICLFQNFVLQQLVHIPMAAWPNKSAVIANFLKSVNFHDNSIVARAFVSSVDPKTVEIGNSLLRAFEAQSLKEAISYLYTLKESLPNFDHSDIELFFDRPFVEFCYDRSVDHDPEFAKRLRFKSKTEVFLHKSLMIGVTEKFSTYRYHHPHLLAYDTKNEKMVWGIPLQPNFQIDKTAKSSLYTIKKEGDLILIHFLNEKKIHFIRPETGEIESSIELPEICEDSYDHVHISQEGFAYQMVNQGADRILIGGRIIDKQWHSSFRCETPCGAFQSFSTHCGFLEEYPDTLVLFGPTGDQFTIPNCLSAQAQADKLYTIEKDLKNSDQCLLTIRTLKVSKQVISEVEKTIPLSVNSACFGQICHRGKIILFSKNNNDNTPIFIDLYSGEVTYSEHKFDHYGSHFINPATGELWTWDGSTKKIWKASPTEIKMLGSINGGPYTNLLHVDQEDQLYFTK